MSHSHPRAIPAARATTATVLVPVDVDAAVDAATMLTALHQRVEQQFEQDHLLDMLMVELGGMIPTDPRYDAKVQVLIQAFRQHALDAEALLVPQLRRRLDPAGRELLGRRLLERIGQLERRPRPGW